ncbi:MAG: hypothetical protein ACRCXZ_08885 [Patescibacteria group bacterium]
MPPSLQVQNIEASKVVLKILNMYAWPKIQDKINTGKQEFIAALTLTKEQLKKGEVLTDRFFIDISQIVHEEYMNRNSWAKGTELDVHFDELSAVEQEKDTNQIMLGITQLIESKL